MVTLHRTTRIASCCCAAVLAGCAKKDNAAVDSTSGMVASTTSSASTASTAPTPIKASDVAGVWNVRAVPVSGDTTASTYVLTATSNTSGWTVTFPGSPPTQGKVTIDGDSIMIDRGPFTSPTRKGVPITTRYVMRLSGGNLVGTNTAHFKLKTNDSVVVSNTVATRAK
jgi:hypothetical protein